MLDWLAWMQFCSELVILCNLTPAHNINGYMQHVNGDTDRISDLLDGGDHFDDNTYTHRRITQKILFQINNYNP